MSRPIHHRRHGFSLIEVLVVIGIIAVLLALLFPALSNAQAHARMIACQSNMRQLGQQLYMYAGENKGWLIPMLDDPTAEGGVRGLGTLLPPKERWPAVVFKIAGPNPESDEPADYCPKVIICPNDNDPVEAHTYALNNPPAAHKCKLGSSSFNGMKSSEVIIAGEKLTNARDYYLEPNEGDFDNACDLFRHGQKHGTNYLFWDGHVKLLMPSEAKAGMDPWEWQTPTTVPSS